MMDKLQVNQAINLAFAALRKLGELNSVLQERQRKRAEHKSRANAVFRIGDVLLHEEMGVRCVVVGWTVNEQNMVTTTISCCFAYWLVLSLGFVCCVVVWDAANVHGAGEWKSVVATCGALEIALHQNLLYVLQPTRWMSLMQASSSHNQVFSITLLTS